MKIRNVHTEHCCAVHGCKYGDADCPVWLGFQKQSYLCECCEWVGDYNAKDIPIPTVPIAEYNKRRNNFNNKYEGIVPLLVEKPMNNTETVPASQLRIGKKTKPFSVELELEGFLYVVDADTAEEAVEKAKEMIKKDIAEAGTLMYTKVIVKENK